MPGPSRLVAMAALALTAGLLGAGAVWAQAGRDTTAAAEPVMRQLEAFRSGDYDAAYAFASEEIRQMFDRAAFERMVKDGYPEIARSAWAVVSGSEAAPDGRVYLVLRIRGVNGNGVAAVYEMVWDGSAWKINGVVTRPDPGFV
ncbi:MAG: DUF4864 domain-containing protein [Candidatus Rokubacteria bacterium]|nr:DUF4864 domain-containing protein [Candidatus Rokubacteria bacterium]